MVTLIRKNIRGRIGYYLKHSIRIGGKVKSIEKFIGYSLPKDLEKKMLGFLEKYIQNTMKR